MANGYAVLLFLSRSMVYLSSSCFNSPTKFQIMAYHLIPAGSVERYPRYAVVNEKSWIWKAIVLCILQKDFLLRRDLSRYVFAKECAIRIDKQQKERYNNVVIDNDVII